MSTKLTEDDLARRAAELAERASHERPESWRPDDPAHEHPQTIAGVLVRGSVGHTPYGEKTILTIRDAAGKEWSVWLLSQVLENEFVKLAPQPGEVVAIHYQGRVQRADAPDYESYRVECDRVGGQIQWGAPAGAASEPPSPEPAAARGPPDAAPVQQPAPLLCDQCGYAPPEHAFGCPSDPQGDDIPF